MYKDKTRSEFYSSSDEGESESDDGESNKFMFYKTDDQNSKPSRRRRTKKKKKNAKNQIPRLDRVAGSEEKKTTRLSVQKNKLYKKVS